MPKTRGRKRHVRTARKKCRPCKRSMRRSKRRMRGGRSDAPTVRTIEGMPVTEKALVSIPGKGIYDIKAFEQHEEDMDFQGDGGTPGYD
jgi:hypothetical protein